MGWKKSRDCIQNLQPPCGLLLATAQAKAILNDIGTEELAHLEMIGAMVSQLTRNASVKEMEAAGLDPYYADHGLAVYPQSAAGIPWSAAGIQSKGDPITDLYENMAADVDTS